MARTDHPSLRHLLRRSIISLALVLSACTIPQSVPVTSAGVEPEINIWNTTDRDVRAVVSTIQGIGTAPVEQPVLLPAMAGGFVRCAPDRDAVVAIDIQIRSAGGTTHRAAHCYNSYTVTWNGSTQMYEVHGGD
jgi:hypothetical protein